MTAGGRRFRRGCALTLHPTMERSARSRKTTGTQFPVERRGVLATCGQSFFEPGQKRIEEAGLRRTHGSFGEALGPGKAAHGRSRQTQGFFDGEERLTGGMAAAHFLALN